MSKYSPLRRFALITILSGMLAWLGQRFVHGNEKAIDIIIYVFSILSGFLIAIMTLFGDIKYNQNVNWRKLQLQENASKQRYSKHFLLFYGYLSVLISVFISVLIGSDKKIFDSPWFKWLEFFYLCLASISIFYSMLLPYSLIQIRKELYDEIIKDKLPK